MWPACSWLAGVANGALTEDLPRWPVVEEMRVDSRDGDGDGDGSQTSCRRIRLKSHCMHPCMGMTERLPGSGSWHSNGRVSFLRTKWMAPSAVAGSSFTLEVHSTLPAALYISINFGSIVICLRLVQLSASRIKITRRTLNRALTLIYYNELFIFSSLLQSVQ